MAVQLNAEERSRNLLRNSHQAFINNDAERGFEEFKYVTPPLQNKVYEQLWIDRNRPPGNPEYGRHTFNDTNGLSSSMQEKAASIDKYLISVGKKVDDSSRNEQQLAKRGHKSGQYIYVEDMAKPYVKTDKVWCPKTAEECTQVGIVIAVVGSVGTCIYSIFQIFSAFKN